MANEGNLSALTVGFIGGGNMAYAIASGLLKNGILQPGQIHVTATNLSNLTQRWSPLAVTNLGTDNFALMEQCSIIFLCIKPQMLPAFSDAITVRLKQGEKLDCNDKLIVSILAGVTLDRLYSRLSALGNPTIVRTMPNTPMQVGLGCTVYCSAKGPNATGSDFVKELYSSLKIMLGSLGKAFEVQENQINAVTGLAGCGPAYVYEFIEALADGGVKQGIPRAMALQLAAQTVMGAAKMVLTTGKHPAVLKDEVCSPGGATIHGVHALEQGSMRGTVMNAVERATKRAEELS
uniref:Pyrroline-5-carboxylate reductase n=1 Tax=Anopheles marajoara TaxID=58244 RepID=A0A2M4BVP5_9DIPT